MKDFPDELRGEIALHLNQEILSLSLFKAASHGCRKTLAQQIKTMFATPGEYVAYRGDAVKYIYFVCSGSLEILDDDESVVALLGKCDLFGIDVHQHPSRSGYDVRSLTYCELQCFDLACLADVFEQYPNFRKSFSEALSDELSFNIADNGDNNSITESHSSHNSAGDVDSRTTLPAISEADEDSTADTTKLSNQADIVTPLFAADLDNEDEEGQCSGNLINFQEPPPDSSANHIRSVLRPANQNAFAKLCNPDRLPSASSHFLWQQDSINSHKLYESRELDNRLQDVHEATCHMQSQITDLQKTVTRLSSNFEQLLGKLTLPHPIPECDNSSLRPANNSEQPLSFDNVPYVDDSPTTPTVSTAAPVDTAITAVVVESAPPPCLLRRTSSCSRPSSARPANLHSQLSTNSEVHVKFNLKPTSIDIPPSSFTPSPSPSPPPLSSSTAATTSATSFSSLLERSKLSLPILQKKNTLFRLRAKTKMIRNAASFTRSVDSSSLTSPTPPQPMMRSFSPPSTTSEEPRKYRCSNL